MQRVSSESLLAFVIKNSEVINKYNASKGRSVNICNDEPVVMYSLSVKPLSGQQTTMLHRNISY